MADTTEATDWLHFSPDVNESMQAFWKRIDTVLMESKTWEVAAAQGGGHRCPASTPSTSSRKRCGAFRTRTLLSCRPTPASSCAISRRSRGKDIWTPGGGFHSTSIENRTIHGGCVLATIAFDTSPAPFAEFPLLAREMVLHLRRRYSRLVVWQTPLPRPRRRCPRDATSLSGTQS